MGKKTATWFPGLKKRFVGLETVSFHYKSLATHIRQRILLVFGILVVSFNLLGLTPFVEPVTVRVGVYENAPKIYTDENGIATGFWAELIRSIAETEDWQIEWVHCSWEECLEKLTTNEIDIMPDVAWSQARSVLYDFSNETILVSWSEVYVPEGSEIETILDLEGKTIAALAGSVNLNGPEGIKDLESKFNITSTFVELNSYTEVFEALQSHEVDAGITNNFFGDLNIKNYDISRTSIIFQPSNIQFAFTKSSDITPYLIDRIDANIKSLKADSESVYYQALDQYLGQKINASSVEVIPSWVITVSIIALGLILFLSIVSVTSNALARKQTAELRASEFRLRAIFESIPDLIFRNDAEGRFLDYHANKDNKLYAPPEQFLGKTIQDVFPSNLAEQSLAIISKTISTKKKPCFRVSIAHRWHNQGL